MTNDMAAGTLSASTEATYWQSVCDTRNRARSGSSGSQFVTNATSRGNRYRAMLWSADVRAGWTSKDLMQLAAILAV